MPQQRLPLVHRDQKPSPVGYDSDDGDLSDGDLNLLNTDYRFQTNIRHHPDLYQTRGAYSTTPSIRTRARTRSANGFANFEEGEGQEDEDDDWERPLHLPRRTSSKQPRYPHYQTQAYQNRSARTRPLIDLIKNEWMHTTSDYPTHDPSEFSTPICLQICFAPKFQRIFLVLFALSFLVWGNWKTWAGRKYHESAVLALSVQAKLGSNEGMFGQNVRPEFLDMTHMRTIDPDLIPTAQTPEKRIIVVGDVHGCYEELVALLSQLQYEDRNDHLIFTGDLISKGPDSPGVVDLAISARASCVRGNHEDRVLLAHRDIVLNPADDIKAKDKDKPPAAGAPEVPDDAVEATQEAVDEEAFTHGDVFDRALARQLSNEQIAFIASCPVILSLGAIPGMGETSVVHAGLIPGVSADQQDPIGVMQMRTVDLRTHVPSGNDFGDDNTVVRGGAGGSGGQRSPRAGGGPGGQARGATSATLEGAGAAYWWKLWNKYQSSLAEEQRATVIYGHDSHVGLQISRYSKGLDSGCYQGGKLSALVIDSRVVGDSNGNNSDESRSPTGAGAGKQAKGKVTGSSKASSQQPEVISVPCKDYVKLQQERDRAEREEAKAKKEKEKEAKKKPPA